MMNSYVLNDFVVLETTEFVRYIFTEMLSSLLDVQRNFGLETIRYF